MAKNDEMEAEVEEFDDRTPGTRARSLWRMYHKEFLFMLAFMTQSAALMAYAVSDVWFLSRQDAAHIGMYVSFAGLVPLVLMWRYVHTFWGIVLSVPLCGWAGVLLYFLPQYIAELSGAWGVGSPAPLLHTP